MVFQETPAEQIEQLTLDIQTARSLTEIVVTIRIRTGFPFAELGESLVYLSCHMREYDYVTAILHVLSLFDTPLAKKYEYKIFVTSNTYQYIYS